jgi:hypothetical protein
MYQLKNLGDYIKWRMISECSMVPEYLLSKLVLCLCKKKACDRELHGMNGAGRGLP